MVSVLKKTPSKISVGMISLGCPKTQVDSELILGFLDKNKYVVADKAECCDVAILNTCTFIQDAKQESVDRILELIELKKQGRIKALVVLGCLVQRYQKQLEKELKEVDAFLGTGEYGLIENVLTKALARKHFSHVASPGFLYTATNERMALGPLYSRYIKISEGCDRLCSFCTIPLYRGKHRSRSLLDVVDEAKKLVDQGATELLLTGQDTTFFGYDTEKKFLLPNLLREINKINGLRWLRVLYAYPTLANDHLIQAILDCQKVCHYLDMPLQHISDPVLKTMKRGTTKKTTYALIEKLRKKIPDLALRTTFIVGFPGETEKMFNELLEFMKFAQFERLGFFTYSQEEDSKAAKLKGQIPGSVKQERFQQGMTLQQQISKKINERLIGKTLEVLIENGSNSGSSQYFGRSYMDAPEIDCAVQVSVPEKIQLTAGEYVKVAIKNSGEYDLTGKFIERLN